MTVAAKEKGPKYKQGQYLTNPTSMFLEICAVINDGVMPLYGIRNPKHNADIQWYTEYELDDRKFEVGIPEFDRMKDLKAGDVFKMGWTDESEYIRILARVGDLVLMSAAPDSKKVKEVTKLSKQIEELTDGAVNPMQMIDDEDRDMLRKMASTTHASKVATEWKTVEFIALMHWQLLAE